MSTQGRVEGGTDADRVVLRIVGRATHALGQPVQEFGNAMINAGFVRFEVDLGSCQHIDSTFAGVMASLSLNLKKRGGSMTLLRTPPACVEALDGLGISGLFSTTASNAMTFEVHSLQPLPLSAKSIEAWAATVLSSHQLLATAHEANRLRLREVLEFLMQSISGIPIEIPHPVRRG